MKHYFSVNCVPQSIPDYQLSTYPCYELHTVISAWFLHFMYFILYRNMPKFCICLMLVELLISCLLFFLCMHKNLLFMYFLLPPWCLSFNRICIALYPAIRRHLTFLMSLPEHMKLQSPYMNYCMKCPYCNSVCLVLSPTVLQHNVKVSFLSCNCLCIQLRLVKPFKRWIKSHPPFASIVTSLPYCPC